MVPIMRFMPCLEKCMDQAAHWDIYSSILQLKGILEQKNVSFQNSFPTLRKSGIYNQSSPSLIKISRRSMLFLKYILMQNTSFVFGTVYGQSKHAFQSFGGDQNSTMPLRQRRSLTGLTRNLCLLPNPKNPTQYVLHIQRCDFSTYCCSNHRIPI